MPILGTILAIKRCPHCKIDQPNLTKITEFSTKPFYGGSSPRFWKTYSCVRCGGAVLAFSDTDGGEVRGFYPKVAAVNEVIPKPASSYLTQAIDSLHSPDGSVMLSASAVDAMLKAKGYNKGDLYPRIKMAVDNHLITEEMAQWAHNIRLDANAQRHADEQAVLSTTEDAQRCTEFALALAEFLFVLPSRVQRGLEAVPDKKSTT